MDNSSVLYDMNSSEKTLTTNELLQKIPFEFYLTISTLTITESVLALIINPFAIYVISKHRVLYRSPTNIFIISSCLADCFYSVAMILLQSTLVAGVQGVYSRTNSFVSYLSYALSTLSMTASLVTSMYIAIERGIATFRPLKYKQWVTPRRAIIVIIINWTYFLTVFTAIVMNVYARLPDPYKLQLVRSTQDAFTDEGWRLFVSPHIYFSIVVSVVIYSAISRSIFKHTKKFASSSSKDAGQRAQKKSNRITKLSMCLLALLIVTWAPLTIINMTVKYPEPGADPHKFRVQKAVSLACIFPLSAFSFLNVIIYALNHTDFRRILGVIFCRRSNRVQPSSSSSDQSTVPTVTVPTAVTG